MKRSMVAAALLLVACQSSQMQDFAPIAGDALRQLIVGKQVAFTESGVATYFADGTYDYVEAGDRSPGTYALRGDTVCTKFPREGIFRCDQYARIGEDHWFITSKGKRFKVASISPVEGPQARELTGQDAAFDVQPDAFIGRWVGKWGGREYSELVVASVTQDGSVEGTYVFQGRKAPVSGKITGATLVLDQFGNGARARYTMDAHGRLLGEFVRFGKSSFGEFARS